MDAMSLSKIIDRQQYGFPAKTHIDIYGPRIYNLLGEDIKKLAKEIRNKNKLQARLVVGLFTRHSELRSYTCAVYMKSLLVFGKAAALINAS